MEDPSELELLQRPQFVFTEMGDGRIVTFGHPTIAPGPPQRLVEEALQELSALSQSTPEEEGGADADIYWLR